jgi:hypothetical protein
MKKVFVLFAGCIIFSYGCNKTSINDETAQNGETNSLVHRQCAANDVLMEQLQKDPSLAKRMEEIESFTKGYIQNPSNNRLIAGGVIEIPVVVNVLYKTTAENISQAQIQSQIDVLNEDFKAINADYNNTPSIFQGVRSGDLKITFVLDQVVRKSTTKRSWGTNDAMKSSSSGGLNAISPTTKLNLWCCNLSNGILGYAQFPGGSSSTDGVVIDNNAFGRTGTVTSPYNKGRTATHEVGHWLNLRHIWGDATCGSDFVGDTPTHNTANYGCPAYPHLSTCSGTPVEMTMNYMDYTYDACMYMFTLGQKSRIEATFSTGGGRNSFAQP